MVRKLRSPYNKQVSITRSAIRRLHARLLRYATRNGVPVVYQKHPIKGEDKSTVAQLDLQVMPFAAKKVTLKINASARYKKQPWVIAHELGHYLGGMTEREANENGARLALSLAPQKDRPILRAYLNNSFYEWDSENPDRGLSYWAKKLILFLARSYKKNQINSLPTR